MLHMGPGQLGQVTLLAAGVNWGCNLVQQLCIRALGAPQAAAFLPGAARPSCNSSRGCGACRTGHGCCARAWRPWRPTRSLSAKPCPLPCPPRPPAVRLLGSLAASYPLLGESLEGPWQWGGAGVLLAAVTWYLLQQKEGARSVALAAAMAEADEGVVVEP